MPDSRRSLGGHSLLRAAPLVVALVTGSPLLHADESRPLRFVRMTSAQGLSENSANAILQDSRGFVWIGTSDGLNRFDGYTFRIYRFDSENPESIGSNIINDILEDRKSRLWIATHDGLDLYDRASDSFRHYGDDEDALHALLEDDDGMLWVGSYRGLSRLDPATHEVTRYTHDPDDARSLSSNRIRRLALETDGRLWVGTEGGGVNLFDPDDGTAIRYRHDPGDPASLGHNVVRGLLVDRDGELWVGTQGGIDRLHRDTGGFTHYRYDPGDSTSLGNGAVQVVFQCSEGQLWVGTDGGGLSQYAPRSNTWIRHAHDEYDSTTLASNVIRAVSEDRNGDLWVGTYSGGIQFLDRHDSGFRFEQRRPDGTGLNHNSVLSFHEDPDGTLWIGTEGGLNRIDGRTREYAHFVHDPKDSTSLGGNAVLALERDRKGRLWVGAFYGGLGALDEQRGTFTHFRHDESDDRSLSNPHVWDILETSSGELWIATFEGLNRLESDTGRFARYLHDPEDPSSLSHDVVNVLFEDSANRLWVGTEGGLSLYDRRTDGFVNHSNLSHACVYSIQEDARGSMWIGTRGGLNRFDAATGSYEAFRASDGLPNETVLGILEDSEGTLWISTNAGLSRFDPLSETFNNYDETSLRGSQFKRGACLESRSGALFFGGIHGFNWFRPEQVQDDPRVPPVVITDFRLFNKPVPIGPGAPLSKHISEASLVTLSHDESAFSFEFAALSFRNPERNRYAYRLVGFDRDWVEAGTRRTATYTNLDPGEYTFEVVGSNDSGAWNRDAVSVRVVVEPPFWMTWWFRSLGVLVFASLIVGVHGLRTRFIRAKNVALKGEIEERKRAEARLEATNEELEERHAELERFTYTVSHDLKSPLVTIQGFLGHVLKDLSSGRPERAREDFERISKAAGRMGTLLDQLLELARVGRAVNPPEVVDLEGLVDEAVDQIPALRSPGRIEVRTDPRLPLVLGDRVRLQEVFQNLVENAAKFMGSQEEPRIEIGATRDGAKVICHVRDNGIGIPPEYHERVFDLFQRLEVEGTGTGVGLAIVKRIVEEHGGRVWIESEGSNLGTTISFTLPDPGDQASS